MKFRATTDTVDIRAKAAGVHPIKGPDDRGLCVQIRHNADKELFKTACEMAKVIEKALNEHFSKTTLRDRILEAFPGFTTDEEVNGADLVEWLALELAQPE